MDRGPMKLHLTVYGQPAGAGSKTVEALGKWIGKRFQAYTDKSGRPIFKVRPASKFTEPWMKEVAKQAAIAWRGLAPLDAALWIDVTFFERRPKGHYFSDGRLRPDAPAYPHVTDTHDCGKMRRAIEDALTKDREGKWAAVWADDKRVVDGHDRKRYCEGSEEEPRAIIVVGKMVAQTVADAGIVSPAPPGQVALV